MLPSFLFIFYFFLAISARCLINLKLSFILRSMCHYVVYFHYVTSIYMTRIVNILGIITWGLDFYDIQWVR